MTHNSFLKQVLVSAWVNDRVVIRDLDRQPATVISVHFGRINCQYEVAWFHNGERKTCYLDESEFDVLIPK